MLSAELFQTLGLFSAEVRSCSVNVRPPSIWKALKRLGHRVELTLHSLVPSQQKRDLGFDGRGGIN